WAVIPGRGRGRHSASKTRVNALMAASRNDQKRSAEIGFTYLVTAGEVGRRALGDDPAFGKYIAVMRDGERLVDVLFDQKDGDAARVDVLDDSEVLLHQ